MVARSVTAGATFRTSLAATLCLLAWASSGAADAPYIRQHAQYTAYPGADSTSWVVTLPGVLAGSTIYVVGTWPNFTSAYPTMGVRDGTNSYVLLDRYDDHDTFNLGIQGTQSMGHWYAANVPAGSYVIDMTPTPGTYEDFVGVAAFEIAGVTASPLGGHTLHFQAGVAPGVNSVHATVQTSAPAGLLIATTFDVVDYTAPTAPLVGAGFADGGPLWNFASKGRTNGFAARAESANHSTAGAWTAAFSPEEAGAQSPDYLTTAAVFVGGTGEAPAESVPLPSWAVGALGAWLAVIGSAAAKRRPGGRPSEPQAPFLHSPMSSSQTSG